MKPAAPEDLFDERPPEIKGWCPGAYSPMQSGDGLLIRAKIIGSRLTAEQARAIAGVAANCGNGEMDLSQRAQLQIRGLSETTVGDALRRLDAVGLLSPSAEAERIVNIVAAPLSGLTGAAFDANALAGALARTIIEDETLFALPGKFLFAIDDDSGLPLTGVDGDVRLEAVDGKIALRLAGAPDQAALVDAGDAIDAAHRLARAFVKLRAERSSESRRMRALVAAIGAEAVFAAAALSAQPLAARAATPLPLRGARTLRGAHYAGFSTPFGRWRARDLANATEFAINEGLGELRLTPWRTILAPTRSEDAAFRATMLARAHGFITSDDDLRLAVVACPGAPECPQAHGATRNALPRFAALAHDLAGTDGVGLHISGCAKGCARPGTTPVTLLAAFDGYELIDHGRACDTPTL
ncbi:MAG: precorrin-3B synthase, partial [Methylocystis sp.]|nr:precorrin-3B synthase [Methylocystis sp.]